MSTDPTGAGPPPLPASDRPDPGEPWGGLTPLDGHRWLLRLAASELAALETDWVAVAGPHPGHDFRRHVVRARDLVGRASVDLELGRRPASGWADRARAHMRAARRVLV